jgi:hypothetical protein
VQINFSIEEMFAILVLGFLLGVLLGSPNYSDDDEDLY